MGGKSLIILVLCFALGYAIKTCHYDGRELEVPDTFDCVKFSELANESASRNKGAAAASGSGQQKAAPFNGHAPAYNGNGGGGGEIGHRMKFLWPGFPFPPWMNWPPFPNSPRIPSWRRRPRRPRPRPPPPSDIEECPDEGIKFISHPTECEKYILCMDGDEIATLTCPAGLHFSRALRSCTSPREAECEDFEWECPDDSTEVSFIPNEEDCTQYYLCFMGEQIPMSCAPGLHWSIEEERCMDARLANCEFGTPFECPDAGVGQYPNPDSCEDYILCVNGNEFDRTCATGLHFSPHLKMCTQPEMAGCDAWSCPEDSDEISFIPNVEDCSGYYICFGGNQLPMTCAAGLHWSITDNMCLDEDDANCLFGEPFECPATGVGSFPNPDSCEDFILCVNGDEFERSCPPGLHFSEHIGACTQPALAGCEGWDCPEDSTEVSFIPNTDDCNAYFVCFMGNKLPMACGNNLHWSIADNMCMDEDDANCPFEDGEEPKRRTTQRLTTQQLTTLQDTTQGFSDCPRTGVHQLPDLSDCEAYVLCVNGMRFERQCPPGLHFSREVRACIDPDDADCDIEGCHPTDLGFLPNPDDCEKYYICFGGNKFPMRCPNDFHWSVEERRCMDPDDAGCEDAAYECPDEGIIQIPDPDDCEKYILCVHGLEIPLRCAPGLHFSPTLRVCVSPEIAQCDDGYFFECPEEDEPGVIVFIPDVEDCNAYFLCWQGNQIPLRCGAGLHWSIEENRCMDPDDAECPWREEDDEIETCPEEGVKAISHPDSCEQYILCVNGFEIERNCPPGMHFSRDIRNCAHPLVANCQDNFVLPFADSTATTENGDICPNINSFQEMVFRPNMKDCQSYYLCAENEHVLFNCAEGYHWNYAKQKCMVAEKANCTL